MHSPEHTALPAMVTTGTLEKNTLMFQAKKEFTTEDTVITEITEKYTQNPLCSLCPRQLLLRCSTSCIRAVVCGEKIRMVFFSCDSLVSLIIVGSLIQFFAIA